MVLVVLVVYRGDILVVYTMVVYSTMITSAIGNVTWSSGNIQVVSHGIQRWYTKMVYKDGIQRWYTK